MVGSPFVGRGRDFEGGGSDLSNLHDTIAEVKMMFAGAGGTLHGDGVVVVEVEFMEGVVVADAGIFEGQG